LWLRFRRFRAQQDVQEIQGQARRGDETIACETASERAAIGAGFVFYVIFCDSIYDFTITRRDKRPEEGRDKERRTIRFFRI